MTHGKIVNKQTGLEIPCILQRDDGTYLEVKVQGTTAGNTFYAFEWDFVADPPALPTEPGLYKATRDTDFSKYHHLLLLDLRGEWRWLSPNGNTTYETREGVEKFAETITRVEV